MERRTNIINLNLPKANKTRNKIIENICIILPQNIKYFTHKKSFNNKA